MQNLGVTSFDEISSIQRTHLRMLPIDFRTSLSICIAVVKHDREGQRQEVMHFRRG